MPDGDVLCLQCYLGVKQMLPRRFETPLCKFPVMWSHGTKAEPGDGSDADENGAFTKRWRCYSPLQNGNEDIPEDWATCESGIDADTTWEELATIQRYCSLGDEFCLCLKCAIKWKKFEFENDRIYSTNEA
jgi:hypothetical protein